MCGHIGIITKNKNGFSQPQLSAYEQLLYADALRGKDGTGIFYNSKSGKSRIQLLKSSYSAPYFMQSKEFSKALDVIYQNSNFAFGHNRAATKGEVEHKNSHPFRSGHIVLAHNGTLSSVKDLIPAGTLVDVDSEAIAISMAENGEEETLQKIDGAFALCWSNSKNNTVNLCRNSQRPLFLIECSSCWIVCSEEELGKWVASRNKLSVVKVEEVVTNKVYSFDLKNTTKYTTRDVKYKSVVYNNWGPYKYQKWYQEYEDFSDHYPTTGEKQSNVWNAATVNPGDMVRVRSRGVQTSGIVSYLSCDLLRNQNIKEVALLPSDFEGAWRARFVLKTGGQVLVKHLEDKMYLVGKVKRVAAIHGEMTIFLETIETYIHADSPKEVGNVPLLGIVSQNCDFCGTAIEKNGGVYTPDKSAFICKRCAKEMDIQDRIYSVAGDLLQ